MAFFSCRVAREVLQHISPKIRFATSRVKSLHAALRRLLHMRGVQTHDVDLQVVGFEWAISRARRRGDFQHFGDILKPTRSNSSTVSAAGPEDVEATGSEEKRRKKNPWNIHVANQTLGASGRQLMHGTSEEYMRLSDDQKTGTATGV